MALGSGVAVTIYQGVGRGRERELVLHKLAALPEICARDPACVATDFLQLYMIY